VVLTLNKDVIAFVNGSNTEEMGDATNDKSPFRQTHLQIHNVTVENQKITRIARLRNGENTTEDPSQPTVPERYLFRVEFSGGMPIERATFLRSFEDEKASKVGQDMGVQLYGGRLAANPQIGLVTNIQVWLNFELPKNWIRLRNTVSELS
jgi:hypothetical protein